MKPIKTDNTREDDEEMIDDEEAESPPASEDEELGEEEEEVEEMQEDGPEPAVENSASEDSLDQNNSDRHPYPTPPPDDGSKMAKAKVDGVKKNIPFINLAIMAIQKLNERSGSSVVAIMKYLKENGHSWDDEKRQLRRMGKTLKIGVAAGQLKMVKRSFKLSDSSKKAHMAVEKMKAKKEKQLAKEKEKEKLQKAKAQKKDKEKAQKKDKEKVTKKATKKAEKNEPTKREKPGKPSERQTNQAPKKKKVEAGAKDVPPKAKTAASVAARALLDTPTNDEQPEKKKAKAKANASEAGKLKKPRKSIGTLAQTKTVKPNVKAVKKLVAAKTIAVMDDVEISKAQATSTPTGPMKGKRTRKV